MADSMLKFFGCSNHRTYKGFSADALEALKKYSWPGNLRELRNMVERITIFCKSVEVGKECLPDKIGASEEIPGLGDEIRLDKIEEAHIRRILASSASIKQAADILGIDAATLWRKRKKYGI
jgi:NtrC-family two-component system response regulator AlgB